MGNLACYIGGELDHKVVTSSVGVEIVSGLRKMGNCLLKNLRGHADKCS